MKRNKWTKEKIVNIIIEMNNNGEPLNSGHMQSNHKTLFRAARSYFGDWKSAVEASNISYEEISLYNRYEKEQLCALILNRYSEGSLTPSGLRDLDQGRIKRYFGTLKNACNHIGIPYEELRANARINVNRKWSEDKILDEIINIYSEGKPLNPVFIGNTRNDLYIAAIKQFGSWKNALGRLGIDDYLDVYADEIRASGFKFEHILGEIFNDIGIEYLNWKDCDIARENNVRPDFILKDDNRNIWVDAKLSEWTATSPNSLTISKYEPLCDELIIVYLRGDKDKSEMISEKTKILSIYKLLEGKDDIISKYENKFNLIIGGIGNS